MPRDHEDQNKLEQRMINAVDSMRRSFEEYKDVDIKWKAKDEAWKENAQPAIETMKNAIGFGKTVGWALGITALLGTTVGGIVIMVPYILPHFVR